MSLVACSQGQAGVAKKLCYRNDPYSTTGSRKVFAVEEAKVDSTITLPEAADDQPGELAEPPIHSRALTALGPDAVRFVPFPLGAEDDFSLTTVEVNGSDRLFIGQVPNLVSDGQLNFAVFTATGGIGLLGVQRIVKWKERRRPGAMLVFCRPCDTAAILAATHRLLFDRGGVWLELQQGLLMDNAHRFLPNSPEQKLAYRHLPKGPMNIEAATSSYTSNAEHLVKHFVAHGERLVAVV